MQKHKAYKTELDPTEKQKAAFRRWAGCRRWVYNWALEQRINHYEATGETLSSYAQDKAITQVKKQDEYEWLNEPPRRVLYYAIQDLDSAFQHFFRRVKNGSGKPGFPRFKSKGRSTESFTVYGTDIRVERRRIRFPKLGWVRLKEKGYIPVSGLENKRHMECTVSRRAGDWMVSVSVEEEVSDPEPSEGTAAAHPGARQLLTVLLEGVGEERFSMPEVPDHLVKRKKRLQRKLARQEKGSNNRMKTKRRIQKVHARISRIRKDATHKATSAITYDVHPRRLIIQAWAVKAMLEEDRDDIPRWLQARINEKVAHANMGEVLRQLRYKAEWASIDLQEIDRSWPVSKACSQCEAIHDDLGMEQVFECPSCGFQVDRETNAAKNLMRFAGALETDGMDA